MVKLHTKMTSSIYLKISAPFCNLQIQHRRVCQVDLCDEFTRVKSSHESIQYTAFLIVSSWQGCKFSCYECGWSRHWRCQERETKCRLPKAVRSRWGVEWGRDVPFQPTMVEHLKLSDAPSWKKQGLVHFEIERIHVVLKIVFLTLLWQKNALVMH